MEFKLKPLFRELIFISNLAIKDVQTRYLGSFLGFAWAFVQPTVQVLIFWFVFQVGFKSAPVDNFPFILWLMAAMVPWFFISDCFLNTTNSIVESSYLVKKVVFRVSLLPVVKVVSSLFIHLFFICFLIIMFSVYKHFPDLYTLQIIYYVICSVCLVVAIGWITSSVVVFLKDVGQFVGMTVQLIFWLTPIFWSLSILPDKYKNWIKLNPVYYIVEGYRNTFIYKRWFWEFPNLTLYYWSFTLVAFGIGVIVFKRLRPHFADVL
ncbi:ABC transporter permease [Paenibacillus beijingensis]|uniref:Transport permease protein n=1 Tax=Paenibacillus beijingensis TaxID=1126833 RepID=A0A0D5NHM5_9BACL|nr:ABC transporter permease [Paenibacillus beijingensis]AJY74605.1 teichoic acid ABC transporter permease [Paenibacillus beijingensis]